MNNLLSYCSRTATEAPPCIVAWLVDARISASGKDLPVPKENAFFVLFKNLIHVW